MCLPSLLTAPTSRPSPLPVVPQRPLSTHAVPVPPTPVAPVSTHRAPPQPTPAPRTPPARPVAIPAQAPPPRPPTSFPAASTGFVDPLFAGAHVTQAADAPALPTRGARAAPAPADPMTATIDYENAPAIPARRSAAAIEPPPQTSMSAAPPVVDGAYLMPQSQGATPTGGPPPPQRRAPKGYTLVSITGEGDNLTAEVRSPEQLALTSASVQVADMQGQLSKRQVPRNRISLIKKLGAVRSELLWCLSRLVMGWHFRATLARSTRPPSQKSVGACSTSRSNR